MQAKLENILLSVSMSPELDSGDLEAAARLILNAAMDGVGAARAGIWELTEEGDAIVCPLLIDRHNANEHQDLRLPRSDYPQYFSVLDVERTIRADDALTHPATACFKDSYLTPLGIGAMLDTPIRYHGKMIGIICCEHIGAARHWRGDECAFTGALADLYGRALAARESAEYRRRLEEANSALEQRVRERTGELETSLEHQKAMQDQLIEAEKMASLGNLVAGIAHEVNTPLGVAVTSNSSAEEDVKGLLAGLAEDKITRRGLDETLKHIQDCLELAATNLNRAAALIANFKQTAVDQSSLHLCEINIGDYLHSVIHSLLAVLKGKNVRVQIDCDENFRVTTFPGVLSQIIMNLVNNSCTHGFDEQTDNLIRITVTPQYEKHLYHLDYHDNGKGMAEEVLKRLFEPFFTTARHRGGSGLGMAIVYNLATQALQGGITVSSKPGEGFTARFTFPFCLRNCEVDQPDD